MLDSIQRKTHQLPSTFFHGSCIITLLSLVVQQFFVTFVTLFKGMSSYSTVQVMFQVIFNIHSNHIEAKMQQILNTVVYDYHHLHG